MGGEPAERRLGPGRVGAAGEAEADGADLGAVALELAEEAGEGELWIRVRLAADDQMIAVAGACAKERLDPSAHVQPVRMNSIWQRPPTSVNLKGRAHDLRRPTTPNPASPGARDLC